MIWPARTRTAEVELEIADDEIGEDDEWLVLIIKAPDQEAGCAPDCERITWGETGQADNQDLIIADNDPVRVEVTHNAGNDTRITEGESFTLTAEIVPPCEPGTRGFDLKVPLTKRLGDEVLASDVPDNGSITLTSCTEPVSVTHATVNDTDDESRNDLFVSFKVGTPTPNSQIYDGDADRGKFETATDAIGFRVIDDDGYGDSLTAVPDRSTGPARDVPSGHDHALRGPSGRGRTAHEDGRPRHLGPDPQRRVPERRRLEHHDHQRDAAGERKRRDHRERQEAPLHARRHAEEPHRLPRQRHPGDALQTTPIEAPKTPTTAAGRCATRPT